MGKAARWFRGLIGLKRSDPDPNPRHQHHKDKRRWSFVKSYRDKENKSSPCPNSNAAGVEDANKHAIAVAAATAAVAEAAVAAAQATAAVVRLTNSNPCGAAHPPPPLQILGGGGRVGSREVVRAAVVVQSYFRGYLARRALRALKGLVKLQALVRGHIMRRKTTETMRCMQAMLRAQTRARFVRASLPESPHSSCKSSQTNHPEPPTPEKFEQIVRAKSSKIRRNLSRPGSSSSRGNLCTDEQPTRDPHEATSARTYEDRADKILEIDTAGKPHHYSYTTTTSKDSTQQIDDENGLLFCTAENSPDCYSSTSPTKRGPFTPTKSDGSRSFLSGISDCPSYMSLTESSKAKMRSMSAPKQRPQYERASSGKRLSMHGLGEHNPRMNPQRTSAVHGSFTGKAYPGSGRLDRLGMPIKDSAVVYYSGYLN